MKRRLYVVTAFKNSWDCYSLMSALILISTFKLDYGPKVRVTLTSSMVEPRRASASIGVVSAAKVARGGV